MYRNFGISETVVTVLCILVLTFLIIILLTSTRVKPQYAPPTGCDWSVIQSGDFYVIVSYYQQLSLFRLLTLMKLKYCGVYTC
jgi:hypothetical protein